MLMLGYVTLGLNLCFWGTWLDKGTWAASHLKHERGEFNLNLKCLMGESDKAIKACSSSPSINDSTTCATAKCLCFDIAFGKRNRFGEQSVSS